MDPRHRPRQPLTERRAAHLPSRQVADICCVPVHRLLWLPQLPHRHGLERPGRQVQGRRDDDGRHTGYGRQQQQSVVTTLLSPALPHSLSRLLSLSLSGSYGGLAMFKRLPRIQTVNASTLIGAGGEYSDFQYIVKQLALLTKADFTYADGAVLSPAEIHSYLSRLLYNRRSKIDPLWNSLIVAGVSRQTPPPAAAAASAPVAPSSSSSPFFLGCVDIYGSNWTADVLATGFGQHLAIPLLRKHHHLDMTYEQAKTLLEDCQRILIYRDCRTLNLFQLATITADGPKISEAYSITTDWSFQRFVNPGETV